MSTGDVSERSLPPAVKHGATSYCNHHCRCSVCVDGHRAAVADQRRRRRAARVMIGGRLTAIAAERHGSSSTYTNHGCRCVPCVKAHSVARANQRSVS